mmetsp:Transcript_14846/g.35723  ORF Transcript_14846/g.35723 Transcript_14846/m.35723 type:complete len:285 (-) Transcript_14846:894-1748(-)
MAVIFYIMHICNGLGDLIGQIDLFQAGHVYNIIFFLFIIPSPQLSFDIPSRSIFKYRRIGTVGKNVHNVRRLGQPFRRQGILPMTVVIPVRVVVPVTQRFHHHDLLVELGLSVVLRIERFGRLRNQPHVPPVPVRQVPHELAAVPLLLPQLLSHRPAEHSRELSHLVLVQDVAVGKRPPLPFVPRFALHVLERLPCGVSILFGVFDDFVESIEVLIVSGVGRDLAIGGGDILIFVGGEPVHVREEKVRVFELGFLPPRPFVIVLFLKLETKDARLTLIVATIRA